MSYNQVRTDKIDGGQLRKSGVRGRGSSGGGRGGGRSVGSGGVAASLSSNQSYKKSSNGQGGQPRVVHSNLSSETSVPNATLRAAQNGAPGPPYLQGSSTSSMPRDLSNPTATSLSKPSQALPEIPSQSSPATSDSASPSTPIKGDETKPFSLQFGTISPGIVNGLQIPARTSSAPPNFDEQKQNQVQHNSFRAGPTQPIPSIPKQPPQQTRNEAAGSNFNSGDSRPPIQQVKREVQVPHQLPNNPQKSSNIPMPGMSMPMQFQPQPVAQQYCIPGPQQIPMMPPQMAQMSQMSQMLFHNLHPHQMLPPMGFGHQISSVPLPPQLPNPSYMHTSQFPQHHQQQHQQQQQMSKYGVGPRKSSNVKITHPDTHEELRLDKVTPQSQPVSSFASAPFFQPTSYNPPATYYSNNPPMNKGAQPPSFNQIVGQSGPVQVRPGNIQYSQRVGGPSVTITRPPSKTEESISKQVIITAKKEEEPSKSTDALLKEHVDEEMKQSRHHEEVAEPNLVTTEKAKQSTVSIHDSTEVDASTTSLDNEDASTSNSSTKSAEFTNETSKEDKPSVTEDNACLKIECATNESEKLKIIESEIPEIFPHYTANVKDTVTEVSEGTEPVLVGNKENTIEKSDVDMQSIETEPTAANSETKNNDLKANLAHDIISNKANRPDVSTSETKPKPAVEVVKTKTISSKKKMKNILSKADAAGTSDLYNAYKGPDEKQLLPDASEDANSSINVDKVNTDIVNTDSNDTVETDECSESKEEVDDWENAAEMSAPKLDDGKAIDESVKKYSRDFLLRFSDKCTDLPLGFKIGSDIDALMGAHGGGHNSYPSPGRIMDRPPGSSRSDRKGYSNDDEDKWNKSGHFHLQNIPNQNFRPMQNANFGGVLRKPYGQSVNQYGQPVNQYGHPLLSAPMQSMVPQGGQMRYNPDADRWQSNFHARGLMTPAPVTPLQVMHKAEKKYEVGKVSDEEQTKQRQLKGILNKLTPQNFERLFQQVKDVNIDNTVTLTGVISQIFDKALMEPTFCEMYANFCSRLSSELPDFGENEEKITFKRLLLNKCQEEFERGEREEAEAKRVEEEGEIKQTDEEREEKRIKARRRMLGNIRLIGELYKKKMLTERIMHECIQKLLGDQQTLDEEDLEALCKLMSTIGHQIDHAKARNFMDKYFESMLKLSTNNDLSSRIRFMLRDIIDLRKNRWQQRRKVEGPKKIEEVHRDAAQERQSQTSRLTRGPSMGSASRRVQDYNPRGSSVLPSPTGTQGMPPQRGYQGRLEDRHPLENRTLSYSSSQRTSDDSIALGPQGGLARGMSRGQPITSSGMNMYNSTPNRAPHSSREDIMPGNIADWVAPISASPSPLQAQGPAGDKLMSEDTLREKSITTIKEFYSAKDEKEVETCIRELNSPSFYPSMVSLWVTDSFERKDKERDMLATLLVNLCRSRDNLLSQAQLSRGFESVLSTLEDAVNDAPRATEFLGRIFVKAILEKVVPVGDIAKLIQEGGEEPGSLKESGLASEVVGSMLEIIKAEKGETVLKDIVTSFNYKLEDFKPPHPMKSKKLDAFL